jgi:hypothetical protein
MSIGIIVLVLGTSYAENGNSIVKSEEPVVPVPVRYTIVETVVPVAFPVPMEKLPNGVVQ